eukprot:5155065-Amphidinium_carterae.1
MEENVYGPWRNMSARNRERSEPCRGTGCRTSAISSRSAEHQMMDERLEVQHDPLYSQDPWQAQVQTQQMLREREAQITQQQRLVGGTGSTSSIARDVVSATKGNADATDSFSRACDEATAAITARARDELASIIQQNKVARDTQMVEVTAKAREGIESIAKRNQLAHDQQII